MSEVMFSADPAVPAIPPTDPVEPIAQPSLTIPAVVADLIGEGKKYATIEAALESIPNAQNHISTIEAENSEYKNALLTNDKLDQVLNRLNTPLVPETPATPVDTGLTAESVSELVQQQINTMEKVNLEKANLTAVESKLRELNGENVAEVFNAKAAEVNMSPAQLTALAKVSPQAVLALFPTKSGAANPTLTTDGVDLSTVGDIGDEVAKKNIMFGASTAEVVSEWRASAPIEED